MRDIDRRFEAHIICKAFQKAWQLLQPQRVQPPSICGGYLWSPVAKRRHRSLNNGLLVPYVGG